MEQVRVTELDYIGVCVKDLDAWRAFACDIMALEWRDEGEGDRVYLRMDYWHHRILLHADGGDDILYAGYRLAGPDEFKQRQGQLDSQKVSYEGATAEEAKKRRLFEYLRLTDPAGIMIELFHGPEVDRAKPIRPGRGMHGPFSTGSADWGIWSSRMADLRKVIASTAMSSVCAEASRVA